MEVQWQSLQTPSGNTLISGLAMPNGCTSLWATGRWCPIWRSRTWHCGFPTRSLSYIALAHVRPSTSHTVFHADFVGEGIRSDLRPIVDKAWNSRSIERSSETNWSSEMALRVEAVPMVRNGRTLAVVTSHMDLSSSRMPSRLELTYRQCAYDLLRMGTLGLWPDFASPTGSRRGAPRVGDGLIRLDAEGIVQYASPNGVSAFRRLGEVESLEGRSLAEVTAGLLKDRRMVDETLPLGGDWSDAVAKRDRVPGRQPCRCAPFHCATSKHRFGALVLCRDVSELRRREMELVTKDATIREIHHRVKNNLQTVAALLADAVTQDGQRRGQARTGAGNAPGGYHCARP